MPHFLDSTGKGYWAKEAKNEGDEDRELPRSTKTDWDAVAGDKAGEGPEAKVKPKKPFEKKVKVSKKKDAE